MVERYLRTVCAMGLLVLLAITPFVPKSSVQAQRQNQDQDALIGTQSVPENSELRDQHRRPGHLLVRFNANASPPEVASLKANRVVSENAALRITHLKVSPEEELAVFDQMKRSSAVEFVEFDSVVTTTFVPNDTYYATPYPSSHYGNIAQWGPPAVSAPAAWDNTQGDSSTVIAIVDTGVDDTHPDLAAKIVGKYSFTGKVKDGFGHGTHCAGIAAAVTNDSVGVAGMCPNCKILSVKVLDEQMLSAYHLAGQVVVKRFASHLTMHSIIMRCPYVRWAIPVRRRPLNPPIGVVVSALLLPIVMATKLPSLPTESEQMYQPLVWEYCQPCRLIPRILAPTVTSLITTR